MAKRLLYIIFMLSALAQTSFAQMAEREFRGVWIATVWGIDWPSSTGMQSQKAELCRILDKAKHLRLNAVCLQVRGMGDALYASSLEPWSAVLTGQRGKNPDWDPLEFAIEECHKRGLECHAWVNPLRWSAGKEFATPLDRKINDSGMLLKWGKTTIFNPAKEQARQHVVDVCREIITRYNVDGLVFDDYFYPRRIPENAKAPDWQLYKSLSAHGQTIGDWRREAVNTLIDQVMTMIESCRSDIRFGISPAGVAATAQTSAGLYELSPPEVAASDWQWSEIYSDPLAWITEGSVDYISPQLYWPTDHAKAPFGPLAKWWADITMQFGVDFFSSHSLAPIGSSTTPLTTAEASRQVTLTRQHSPKRAPGFIFYSAKYLDILDANLFPNNALTPKLPRQRHYPTPAPPASGTLKGVSLQWQPSVPTPGLTTVKYAVYTSGKDGRWQFEDITYTPQFRLSQPCAQAIITTLDGLGGESDPLILNAK